MQTVKQQQHAQRMQKVATICRQLIEAGITESQSEAMKLAWKKVKAMEVIAEGGTICFTKANGEFRIVLAAAQYTQTATPTTTRKPQPQIIVFVDTLKEGENKVVSADIRRIYL